MICIKADIPKQLNEIDDELKAIYHSKDTVCFYIFKTRDLRNEFVEKTKKNQYISASSVFDGKFDESIFKDKYVLIGASAQGLFDLVKTPFSK